MMRTWAIIGAASLQVLILGFMAGQREAVVLAGERIWLRSAPIDPRDIFRGDFVRLSYEASNVHRDLWQGQLMTEKAERGDRVYAMLAARDDALARVVGVTDAKPADGLFMRGRARRHGDTQLNAAYGLEAYFMQQGDALELEHARTRGGEDQVPVQVPLDMEVAVGGNGIAVLCGHRWAPLGFGIRLQQPPRRPSERRQRWEGVAELALMNASDEPLAIVDLPEGASFELRPIERWQGNPCHWAGHPPENRAVTDDHVRLLQPGERYTVTVNLRDPVWHVTETAAGDLRSVPDLENGRHWFRLVYSPPPPEMTAGLVHADLIWHGELLSRAFNSLRRVD